VDAMAIADALRYVRRRLDLLNAMRLDNPFTAEQGRSYQLLCTYEAELLEALVEQDGNGARADVDLRCPLLADPRPEGLDEPRN
jgi:hypothetical protein